MANSQRSSVLLLKEGFLMKRGEIIKKWVRRYCVLNPQCLCYFKKQTHDEDVEPMGRVFLDDIINIENEALVKKKPFCFCLHTDNGNKRKSIYFNASSEAGRLVWINCIKNAKEKERRAEREDPFRKTLKKLTKGLKRIKLQKDSDKRIGCTIKNAAGVITVCRIIEDGLIAATGVLKPGDEILEIHGTTVTNKSVNEVAQIIRECPDEFLATVRPLVSVHKPNDPQTLVVTSDDHAGSYKSLEVDTSNNHTDHNYKYSYKSIEAVDTSNNHTDHDYKHSYQSIEAVDTSNNHTDHDYKHSYQSIEAVDTSNNHTDHDYKHSYQSIEAVDTSNNHTDHDYKHSYKSIEAVDTSNNHTDHDYKHSYKSIEAVDTSNNHTDHDYKHSYKSIEAVDTSNNHTDHDYKHPYKSMEAVDTSNNHTDHDYKHPYKLMEAVDTSNNHADHDYKHPYKSMEAVDTSNNHTDHDLALECVQDNESAPPLSPSPPPICPHTKESYILLESVNSLNSHTDHDYKHSYKLIEAVDTSNSHADHDYKPTSNGTDKLKRRPHVYEGIDTKFNPVVNTNGMPSGAKKMSRSTPDILTYADLDFRQ